MLGREVSGAYKGVVRGAICVGVQGSRSSCAKLDRMGLYKERPDKGKRSDLARFQSVNNFAKNT